MAPTTYSCTATACEFVTPEAESAVAMELLKMHHHNQHALVQQPTQAGGQAAGQAKPRAEKVPRPQIKLKRGTNSGPGVYIKQTPELFIPTR